MTNTSDHVLIVRNERNRHEFERYDFHSGLWFPCPRPRTLRAIISDLVSELKKAPFALTISPGRLPEVFARPDAVPLPADGSVLALVPFEPRCEDHQLSRMQSLANCGMGFRRYADFGRARPRTRPKWLAGKLFRRSPRHISFVDGMSKPEPRSLDSA